MLEASQERILADVGEGDLVLDVGGWAKPLPRADWVIDLMPYRTRGLYGYDRDAAQERFDAATWVERDICDREPWPFEDGRFELVVCSHTLEDVRDPVWVCSEMVRVARRGYIEVPSRLEEQAYGVQGPWAGWGHHRWLIDIVADSIEFVLKHHVLHGRESDHFPAGFWDQLSAQERVQTLWWRGSFSYRERVIVDPEELDAYLADLVAANQPPTRSRGRRWRGGR